MGESARSIVFVTLMGVVSAGLLTAVHRMLPSAAGQQDLSRGRALLRVLGAGGRAGSSSRQVAQEMADYVRVVDYGQERFYFYHPQPPGPWKAVAIEFSGPGHRSVIRGVLALEADGRTIRGIEFYEQDETPSLGGQIGEREFCRQFVGKSIYGPGGGGAGIRLRAPASMSNEVDAISGATVTSRSVQKMINQAIQRYEAARREHGF